MSMLSDISTLRSQPHGFIQRVLDGTLLPSMVVDFESYSSIYKIRHDAIHWLICQSRDIPFGERPISKVFELYPEVKSHKLYHLIEKQTPDSIQINGRVVKIMELTVSRMKMAEIKKYTKYRVLTDVLKSCGFDVQLEVIAINTLLAIPDRELLYNEHNLSDDVVTKIYNTIRNVDSVLYQINETDNGILWLAQFKNRNLEKVNFGLEVKDVLDFFETLDFKPFNSSDDLAEVMWSDESKWNNNDEQFLNLLTMKALDIDSTLLKNQSRASAINELRDFHKGKVFKYTLDDIRSFMPLPYFISNVKDSAIRVTLTDDQEIERVFSLLKDSRDWFLQCLSDDSLRNHEFKDGTKQSWIFTLHLNEVQRSKIALRGPGRKHFIAKNSELHIESQRRRKNIWHSLNNDFDDEIDMVAHELSLVESIDENGFISGPAANYLKICQSVYREVNINALRKQRKGKRFILRPTGVEGLYVLIHPGGRLRTGEDISTIWFKLLMEKEKFQPDKISNSWVFKKLLVDVNFLHSDWISTDANRLDHYLRCFDKIQMAYATYCSFGDHSLREEMKVHRGNTLGIITMIYMENRRSTSKMLQDVRYLIMTVLSMFSYYGDVLKKFKEPLRSPLQSYLLDKMLQFINNKDTITSVLSSKFGTLDVEAGSGESFDRLTGAHIILPRILTKGSKVNFKQILCEMYFTMLFNKNQDDPTHASFQILTKILEGEQSFREVEQSTKLHNGFCHSETKDAIELIDNPHRNQFSRRAIMTASKLQAKDKKNHGNAGIAHTLAATSNIINKSLHEFGTYKSSSTFENRIYKPKNTTSRAEKEASKSSVDYAQRKIQNPRIRCIEGVLKLINKGYLKSFDLVLPHIRDEFVFQIFKKNQIGGVREILILDIEKRVLVNILESFSRVICQEDDREMLTHGDRKNTLLRDILRDMKRSNEKRLIMNYNFDKTKWAPSFMPIQFLYMFVPFKEMYPSLFNMIAISLMNHSNKKFLLPEKLIRAWSKDEDNNYVHQMDKNLQALKENFLKTRNLAIPNHSNMGQGILHYTSSYFHLCVLSLRDEIYKRLCKKLDVTPGVWMDLVSSDDSYTAHGIPKDNLINVKLRINLFLKAQEVVERVMNVWTSNSKSSISLLIYEFNSLFGSNLTMYPTTLKFTLAAVHPLNTDSFFRMCKEGYISCRQIVENGGSLELYSMASKLNKIFSESIYHTYQNGHNDFSKFNLRPNNVPYQLGVYPICDPSMMILFGPEVQNYDIIHRWGTLSNEEKHVFKVMHTVVKTEDPEVYASMQNVDSLMVGVNRIEARIGAIRRLEYIKRKWNADSYKELINQKLLKDPLMLFRDPRDKEELMIRTYIKLFQNSAAEALRTTAPSLYYGRVSATVSANAFEIPFSGLGRMTYAQCVNSLFNMPASDLNIQLFYPHMEEFINIKKLSTVLFDYEPRSNLETQNIRMLQINRLSQRITNRIPDVLQHFWVEPLMYDPPTSYIRDWINIQEMIPIIRPSLIETLEEFQGDENSRVKSLLLLIMRLIGYSTKPMKAIIFGPSSRSYDHSYLILKQQNQYHNMTSSENKSTILAGIKTKKTDKLFFAFNAFILSVMKGHYKSGVYHKKPLDVSHMIDDDEIGSFLLNNGYNDAMRKKIMIMLIYHGLISDVSFWSERTHTIFHQWDLRSKGEPGSYYGDYILRCQLGDTRMLIEHKDDHTYITMNRIDNNRECVELLHFAVEQSGMTSDQFWRSVDKGIYLLTEKELAISNTEIGFKMTVRPVSQIRYSPGEIVIDDEMITLLDHNGSIMMRTILGLLHTDFVPDVMDWDIRLMGISLKSMMNIRPFDLHFSLEYCHDSELFKILQTSEDPLKVKRPHVTRVTNERLGTMLPEREYDEEYEEGLEMEKTDIKGDDDTNDIFSFIAGISEEDITTFKSLISEDNDLYSALLSSNDLPLIQTMMKKRIIYNPKRILERVVNMKYHILARMMTNTASMNRSVIEAVRNTYQNVDLVYALIYVYDRLYSNVGALSPSGCDLRVNHQFMTYFDIKPVSGLGDL